jgi:transcriptional regulator with XRE-family HTH domain
MSSKAVGPVRNSSALKRVRKAKGMTLRELGDRVGAHFTTIAKLEKNERAFTHEWAARIAPVLGVEINELYAGAAGGEGQDIAHLVQAANRIADALETIADLLAQPRGPV